MFDMKISEKGFLKTQILAPLGIRVGNIKGHWDSSSMRKQNVQPP
jgi:hypothetical protein